MCERVRVVLARRPKGSEINPFFVSESYGADPSGRDLSGDHTHRSGVTKSGDHDLIPQAITIYQDSMT